MPRNPLRPIKRNAFDSIKAQHLLSRAGFGGTPAQVQALLDMGPEDAVDHLVNYDELPTEPVLADMFDRNIMSPATAEERQELRLARERGDELILERYRQERQERQRTDREQLRELRKWWLTRMIETARPLEEKMTLFWHGHFATSYRTIEDSYHLFLQNQLFRRHAVGNFAELCHAIIRDPAMIEYLDNDQNNRNAPNENLARELMELFTLGEGHVYSERDIKEGARALTGYTFIDDAFIDMSSRLFQRRHDPGEKTIFGRTGNFNGDDFVDLILTRKEASQYICLKLYTYFVNDLPDGPGETVQKVVLNLARELRDERYELRDVLRTLFLSEHFYEPHNIAAQIKSPIQLIVQAMRTLHPPPRSLDVLLSAADLMGQNLFMPPSVKGWDGGRAWINTSTLFVRQNLMLYMLTGKMPEGAEHGPPHNGMQLVQHLASESPDIEAIVRHLLTLNLGMEPAPQRVGALKEFVNSAGGKVNEEVVLGLLALITALPEYQLC